MNALIERIIGYVLVIIGLICILLAFISIYSVFTGAATPPEIFKMKNLELTINPTGIMKGTTPVDLTIDSEMRKVVNMFLHYLFMAFVLMVGSKIGSIGVMFITGIRIKGPAAKSSRLEKGEVK